jgi:hypothetical protein
MPRDHELHPPAPSQAASHVRLIVTDQSRRDDARKGAFPHAWRPEEDEAQDRRAACRRRRHSNGRSLLRFQELCSIVSAFGLDAEPQNQSIPHCYCH